MKNFKTLISKSKYLLLMLLVAFSVSCSPEDGNDGAPGPAGTNGEDGNANVQTLNVDISTLTGTSFSLAVNEITQDVIDNDVILTYIERGSAHYPIPGNSFSDMMEVELSPVDLDIYFYNRTDGAAKNIPAGRYTNLKIVIIESTSTSNTTGKTISTKQDVYNELNLAGVNFNDYYAVCDYYGIAY